MSQPLVQILDLIFVKISTSSTQTLLSTWKATLKKNEVVLSKILKSF